MKTYPKIMISQPMLGLDNGEIIEKWEELRYKLLKEGYEVISTFIREDISFDIIHLDVWYLAKSIEYMSVVDAVYFCKGWENARGCKIEHEVAKNYGLEIIYEE